MTKLHNWTLVVPVAGKDESVLTNTLLKSPDVNGACEVIPQRGYASAAAAYNDGLAAASNDLVVFAHSDVYFPEGWLQTLEGILSQLEEMDPNWGVLGVTGVALTGLHAGYVYSTGLKSIVGQPFRQPVETISVDEMVLITRKSSGVRFDNQLPGFHMYGTDICLEAKRKGMKSYIVPAFCIHNSIGIRYLSLAFWRSYLYMRKKWWRELPVKTCCTTISKTCWPVVASLKTSFHKFVFPQTVGTRASDPERLYRELPLSGNSR